MKIKALSFFTILTISLLTGCNDKEKISDDVVAKTHTTKTTQSETKKAPLPTFNLTTSTGKTITIIADNQKGWTFKGLEGKAILIDFFGTWCPPCKAEIPHLNSIRNKISDKFEVIGIDVGSRRGEVTPPEELKAFIEEHHIKYPVTTGGDNNALFRGVMELNKAGSIPFMLLFNSKGEFVTHYIGMVPEEMMQSDIDNILGQ